MAVPSPPFVNVEGVLNLRDIGGYPTTPGHCVRRGLIYRSADFNNCTKNGLKQLMRLEIIVVFDLRSEHDLEKAGKAGGEFSNDFYERWTRLPAGPTRTWVPVFEDKDYSPEGMATRFKDYASKGTEASY